MAGMEKGVHHIPVVGQQNQTFAFIVQPPHRIQTHRVVLELVHHRYPAFRVRGSAHFPYQLIVGNVVLLFLNGNRLTVHRYLIPILHLNAHFGHHLTVHRHVAFADQLFRRTARGNAAKGKIFLQAHWHEFINNLSSAHGKKTRRRHGASWASAAPPGSWSVPADPYRRWYSPVFPGSGTGWDADH